MWLLSMRDDAEILILIVQEFELSPFLHSGIFNVYQDSLECGV